MLRVELMRAARRTVLAEQVQAEARRVLERMHLVRIDDAILARAESLPPRPLRSLDAIHLATALDLSPPPDVFLCYDERLAAAARWHGLAVVSPGAGELHEP